MSGRRPELALFALALSAYAYFYQAGGWNQNSRFDLVRAIVDDGSSSIDRTHRNTGDKACRGPDGRCKRARPGIDHYFCDKAPGASWLAVPAYAVARTMGSPASGERFLAPASHAATVWAIGVPSALAVAMLFSLCAALGMRRGLASLIALGWGFATLAFPYSTLLYGHQLAASLLVIGFALLVRARHGGRASGAALAAAGFALGAAVVVEYPAALASAALVAYAAVWLRPLRRAGWIALGMAVPAAACAVYHAAVFGSPLALPYEFSTQPHRSQGFFMGLGVPQGEALGDILLSPYRGLLFSAPWLALAFPGAAALMRQGRLRAEAMVCIAIVLLFLWLNASLVDWQGGWAMGARYLVPSLPFWALLAGSAVWLARGRTRRVLAPLALAAGVLSAFLMLAGTAVKPEVPTHIRHPFGEVILPAFARGELATSRQSIDSPSHPAEGPRRAYNVGHKLGLDGGWSLLPLAAIAFGAAVWLRWTLGELSGRGRRRRTSRPHPDRQLPTGPAASTDPPEPGETPRRE